MTTPVRHFKSAWADPEHVRLAMDRSWWDETGSVLRGALPADGNSWQGDVGSGPARQPQEQVGRRGFARHDDYAFARCGCGHLVYADEAPGGTCRFCPCADHRPAGAA